MNKNKKNILVVAAHPDDEVLFCGGTIKKYSDMGHNVNLFIATYGMDSRKGSLEKNQL